MASNNYLQCDTLTNKRDSEFLKICVWLLLQKLAFMSAINIYQGQFPFCIEKLYCTEKTALRFLKGCFCWHILPRYKTSELQGLYHFGPFGKPCISWAISVESSPFTCPQWNSKLVQYAPELHAVSLSCRLFKVTQFTCETAVQNLHLPIGCYCILLETEREMFLNCTFCWSS